MGPLHGKQGQGEGQQQVGNGQVKEEGVGQREGACAASLRVSVASDHAEHQHVAHNSQEEHQRVHDRGVQLCKAVDVLLRARGRARLARFRGRGVTVFIVKDLLTKERDSHILWMRWVVQEKLSFFHSTS